jgi:hypothetical protein
VSNTALVREKGCRVVLNGYGGDEWLFGSFIILPILLAVCGFCDSPVRQTRILLHADAACSSASVFVRYGLRPHVPGFARKGIKAALGKNGNAAPVWFSPRLQFHTIDRTAAKYGAPADLFENLRRQRYRRAVELPFVLLIDRNISGLVLNIAVRSGQAAHQFLPRSTA